MKTSVINNYNTMRIEFYDDGNLDEYSVDEEYLNPLMKSRPELNYKAVLTRFNIENRRS